MSDGFKTGPTLGGKVGCVVSALVGLPLTGFAFAAVALGDCKPGAPCISGWVLMIAALAITAVIGFGVWVIINWISRRGESDV